MTDKNSLHQKIVETLQTIYDPEIPVNIHDLGLIYNVDIDDDASVMINMTLTNPNCPIADDILSQVKSRVEMVEGVTEVFINLTFDPPWDPERITDEAKLELGLL
ncbi:MAG TPA: iron-sulfur cluster assembly protein [Salinivirgaceae bacterium]|nr:iron-sulfur cluster assembly protein [Salinivirgaceae bacterium]